MPSEIERSELFYVDKTPVVFYNNFMTGDLNLELPDVGGKKIALALSGGRDSVALAHALLKSGIDFFAVNVEHGIRGEASLADSAFTAEFCAAYGIKLRSFSVDAPAFSGERGLSLEQGARQLRYSIFEDLLSGEECDYVALAHHREDQIETVLMRIFRGTGLKGLIAMRSVSGKYLRPLINCSREDINTYVAANGLTFVEDETNADTIYTRNFLREEIKRIKERYPALGEAIARLSRNAEEAENFIEGFVPEVMLRDGEAYVKKSVVSLPAVGKRAVFKAIAALGVTQDIEERHFDLIFDLCASVNGKRIELPHGVCAHSQDEYVVFSTSQGGESCECEYRGAGTCGGGLRIERVSADEADLTLHKDGVLYADEDAIPEGCVIRSRSEGDFFTKFGGGTKSLGDFLTDRKIPLRKRDALKLLACGHEILAIGGIEISEKIKVTDKTENIIRITEDKNVR